MTKSNRRKESFTVLYKVSNAVDDAAGHYNAFEISGKSRATLASVKKNFLLSKKMKQMDPDRYYWRVRVDAMPGRSKRTVSKEPNHHIWRDIRNENAPLPLKKVSCLELSQMLAQRSSEENFHTTLTKSNRPLVGTIKDSLFAVDQKDDVARVHVIILKILDIGKVRNTFVNGFKEMPHRNYWSKPVTFSPWERKLLFQPSNVIERDNTSRGKQDTLSKKIYEWSHDYGHKKDLHALLSTLHEILWKNSGWTPVNIEDLSDPNKCTACYRKALRITFRDKTLNPSEDTVYVAKHIFDMLHRAKQDYDEKEFL